MVLKGMCFPSRGNKSSNVRDLVDYLEIRWWDPKTAAAFAPAISRWWTGWGSGYKMARRFAGARQATP